MNRLRNISQGTLNDTFIQRTYNRYGVLTGTTTETYVRRIHTDVMSDVKGRYIPDIRRPVVNPMAHYKEETVESMSTLRFNYFDGSYFTQDGLVLSHWLRYSPPDWGSDGPWPWLNYDKSAGFNQVKLDCLSKIDKTPYAFMEDLFELKSTLSSLRNPLQSAVQAAGKFQGRRKSRVGYYLKRGLKPTKATAAATSDAWLASRYEFRPLMYSMFGILDELAGSKRARAVVMRSSATDSNNSSGTKQMTGSGCTYSYTSDIMSKWKVGVYYTVSNPLDGVSWDLGLRLKDIPNTIWAVMPYSWVIDRFVNISGFIRAFTNLVDPNVHILAGYQTRTADINSSLVVNAIPASGWTGGGSAGPIVTHIEHFDRTPWSPSLSDLSVPSFDTNNLKDLSNLADLAALAAQRLR